MSAPTRFQLSRQKGSRRPEGAVTVARPTKWGNPFRFGHKQYGLVRDYPDGPFEGRTWDYEGRISSDGLRHDLWFSAERIVRAEVRMGTRAEMVELYRLAVLRQPTMSMQRSWPSNPSFGVRGVDEIRAELAGVSLGCWCPLPDPGAVDHCHAAVLLRVAGGGEV